MQLLRSKLSYPGKSPRAMAVKTDMERLGLFKQLGYTTIGDPYKPQYNKPFNTSAGKGRQMLIGSSKSKCALQMGYFDSTFTRQV